MIDYVWICDTGLTRLQNQDRAGAFASADMGLFYVADGIGGHYAGEKASSMVEEELRGWWADHTDGMTFADSVQQLHQLLCLCNSRIRSWTPAGKRCGTTAAVLWVQGGEYAVLSIGDSRCYLTQREGWRQKTSLLTADDIEPQSGKLSRALGAQEISRITVYQGLLEKRGLFALCTDGIYKVCPPQELERCLSFANWMGDLDRAVTRIENSVRSRQAPDNYSLVLVRRKGR